MKKKCCDCKSEKELEEFSNNCSSKDGKQNVCKICQGIRVKKYREKHKEICAARGKAWRERNRESCVTKKCMKKVARRILILGQ